MHMAREYCGATGLVPRPKKDFLSLAVVMIANQFLPVRSCYQELGDR